MSLTIFPAQPGTKIITRLHGEKTATLTPVVGYQHIAAGPTVRNVVFPLTIMPNAGLTRGRALVTPDGMVSDPSFGVVCESVDEWMRLTGAAEYWNKPESPAAKPEKPTEPAADERYSAGDIPLAPEPGAAPATGPAPKINEKPKAIPDKPKRAREPRVFKTTSYWKFQKDPKKHDPRWDCIWTILGGQAVPFEDDPDFRKITGEEYKALKKAGWSEIDPRANRGEHMDRMAADEFMERNPPEKPKLSPIDIDYDNLI